MALFKDDKEIDKKNSMSNFLFSTTNNTNNNKTQNKSSTLMFGGEYSNNKHPENNIIQKYDHKKIPMFGDNNAVTLILVSIAIIATYNVNNKIYKFEFSAADIKPYNVRNSEHQRMLVDLRGLVDYYMNVFSEEDQKKICFLIDKLKNEL